MTVARLTLPTSVAALALGILLAEHVGPATGAALIPTALLGAALAIIGFAWPRKAGRTALLLASVALIGTAAGTWRQVQASAPPDGPSVQSLVDHGEHEITGRVAGDPRPRDARLQVVLGDLVAQADGAEEALADRLLVWLPHGVVLQDGDLVRLRTRVEVAEDFDGFAYRAFLARQGIGGIGRAESVELLGGETGPASLLTEVRDTLLGGLNRVVPEPQAALGAGILLGVRAAIAPEINEAFERAGLTHIVAISGWNIAIVAALVAALTRPLERRAGRWAGALVSASAVAGYVVLTGATPSVVRAALMAGAILAAKLGGSRAHGGSALGLAALLMLLAAPSLLWDVGFQLSVLATGGLIWFGAPVERRLAGWPTLIREPVALTLAAQFTTLPVILVNFERLSLIAPLANVLVVPLVPLAMLFSAMAAVTGVLVEVAPLAGLADVAAWLAGGTAWLVLGAMITAGSATAAVPLASVDVSVPAPLAVAWLPVLALAAWALGPGPSGPTAPARQERPSEIPALVRRIVRPLPLGGALVVILSGVSVASLPDGRLHLTVLDVGQGDAILVETPGGATMLVDGGPDPGLTLRRIGANVPFFARDVDVLLLSHPHQDHVAGLVEVLARFEVAQLLHAGIDFENQAYHQLLADAAADRDVTVTLARTGQGLRLDPATTLEILYPTEADAAAPLPEGDINNGSVVALLRHGAFEALLTGDAEAPIEEALLRRGVIGPVEMLKVGHHGSSSSTTPSFLAALDPDLAVISAGADNEYGHPAYETLSTLAAHSGVAVHRTDLDGDVQIATDGATYRVHTAATGWSGPIATRGGPPRLAHAGSIGPCPPPTPRPPAASSTPRTCPMESSGTPRASLAWRSPPPAWWPRRRSPSTARWWRRPPCSTTSTRSRFVAAAVSTASWARGASRPRATPSSPCRSPPTRSAACSTRTASLAAGHRSSSRSPTGTWRRSS